MSTDWRAVKSLAKDECQECTHARREPVLADIEALMCHHPLAVERNYGTRLSCGIARDYVCRGRMFERATRRPK
jgi:hypothetical protein